MKSFKDDWLNRFVCELSREGSPVFLQVDVFVERIVCRQINSSECSSESETTRVVRIC